MKKKNVLVVLGGTSKERKISLATGRACIKALKKIGYKVSEFDPAKQLLNEIDKSKVDLIFNALHGKDGEDGNAQSYFEYLRIPYTHSGVIASMNAMDKTVSKQIFKDNKILSPKYFVLKSSDLKKKNLKSLINKHSLGSSVVIKPSNEGSSIGVKICSNFQTIKKAINVLKKKYENLIFEKFIGGQEVQVAVLNNKALGAIELKPKRSFYDYKAKYEKSAKTSHIMPANLPNKKYTEVLKIAERTHRILRCRGVTRCDFKYFKNRFYLLEINTQPGMTDLSLVPEIASYKGISFENLVKFIVQYANINK